MHVARAFTSTLDLASRAIQILSLMVILFVIEPVLFLLLVPVGIPYLASQWRLTRRQFAEMQSIDLRYEGQAVIHSAGAEAVRVDSPGTKPVQAKPAAKAPATASRAASCTTWP